MPYELQTSEGTLPYTVVSVERFPEFREKISEIKRNAIDLVKTQCFKGT